MSRSQIIAWDSVKQNGDEIDYPDVINEYVHRKGFVDIQGIKNETYNRWHDQATTEAEAELKRLSDLALVCIFCIIVDMFL